MMTQGLFPGVCARTRWWCWVGTTPPQAKYFGFTPYLFDRTVRDGTREARFASLGDTLNHLYFSEDGQSPFNREVAVLFTADAASEARVRDALKASGFPESSIRTVPLPASVLQMGLSQDSDRLELLMRVAVFADQGAGDLYTGAPQGTLYRLSRTDDTTGDALYGMPALKDRPWWTTRPGSGRPSTTWSRRCGAGTPTCTRQLPTSRTPRWRRWTMASSASRDG